MVHHLWVPPTRKEIGDQHVGARGQIDVQCKAVSGSPWMLVREVSKIAADDEEMQQALVSFREHLNVLVRIGIPNP